MTDNQAVEIIELKREITNCLSGKRADYVLKALAFATAEVIIGVSNSEDQALSAAAEVAFHTWNKISLFNETVGWGVPEGHYLQ